LCWLSLLLIGAAGCGSDPDPRGGPFVEQAAVGDGLLVAVGHDRAEYDPELGESRTEPREVIWISEDGTSWAEAHRGAPIGSLGSVAYGDGRWVAVGTTRHRVGGDSQKFERIAVSEDGRDWEVVEVPPEAEGVESVAFHDGEFFVVTSTPADGNRIGRTADGRSWEWIYQGENWWAPGLAANDAAIVVYGEGPTIAYSTDGGETWEPGEHPRLTWVRQAAVVDGVFYAEAVDDCCFGEDPDAIEEMVLRSEDGVRWTRVGDEVVLPSCRRPVDEWSWDAPTRGSLVRLGEVLVDTRCALDTVDGASDGAHSRDGLTWEPLALPPSPL
jgi:hypothetical protein